MTNITNVQKIEKANCCGTCDCGNCSCGCDKNACSCQERKCECGCKHTAARG